LGNLTFTYDYLGRGANGESAAKVIGMDITAATGAADKAPWFSALSVVAGDNP
jgi:hypothetical protein